ncbi:MAG TPA: DUF5666 domain-containing protein [Candidatus Bathyarchaeia archaeon]|nr:DUF5666 domain-containing protein [Candidatus Bathyarchaeia archaeon]
MQNRKFVSASLITCMVFVTMIFIAPPTHAATKTVKDLIVKSTDTDKHEIKAIKDGHTYTIDNSESITTKYYKGKSGHKTLKFSDIKNGDVLNVKGSVDSDHNVVATEVRDRSATSSATIYGVVEEINSATQTVKLDTPDRGKITVAILKSTSVKYDGKKRKFTDIREDDKVLVTGNWNSSKKTITKTKKFYILVLDDYTKLD